MSINANLSTCYEPRSSSDNVGYSSMETKENMNHGRWSSHQQSSQVADKESQIPKVVTVEVCVFIRQVIIVDM